MKKTGRVLDYLSEESLDTVENFFGYFKTEWLDEDWMRLIIRSSITLIFLIIILSILIFSITESLDRIGILDLNSSSDVQ